MTYCMLSRLTMVGLFLAIFFVSPQLHSMTTQGNQILSSSGDPVELKGVNWFGFNNQGTMVDGLWNSSDTISFDFATIVYRLKLLGFNAVRLPFSFKDLYQLAPRNFSQSCPGVTLNQIQASVTNPSVPVSSNQTIPPMTYPAPGTCNSYLPNDSTLNRFLWVVNFFAKNGIYVLIDNHLREDQTVLEDKQRWIQDWVQLITAISQDPISKDKVMVDLLNEPDNFGIRWEASGSNPALKDLYLTAMDALYQINPALLFFIEGTGQGGIGANWGDGFATNSQLISQYGLSDPNPFFQALLQKPYVNQVVISPHVYPPSVTGASSNFSGSGLWNRLSSSFGYLTQQGYCSGSNPCKIFPVAVGEFGSRFTDSRDLQSMPDIASYLNNAGAAADGFHQSIKNSFYWAWNANSGDTGGLVGDNWHDIIWQKIDYLTRIGLKPWYLGPSVTKYGTLCVSVLPVDGLPKEYLKPITAGGYSYSILDFDQPVCESVAIGDYTVMAPRIIVSNYQFDAIPQSTTVFEGQTSSVEVAYQSTFISNSGSFAAAVQIGTPWQASSGIYNNVINLYIKNTGTQVVNAPWTLTVANNSYQNVSGFWNMQVNSTQNGTILAVASNNWEVLMPNGANTINVGMIVSSTSNNFLPTSIRINDQPCSITVIQ